MVEAKGSRERKRGKGEGKRERWREGAKTEDGGVVKGVHKAISVERE